MPESQWDEKILDSVNYLILLDALLQERRFAEQTKFQNLNSVLGEK